MTSDLSTWPLSGETRQPLPALRDFLCGDRTAESKSGSKGANNFVEIHPSSFDFTLGRA